MDNREIMVTIRCITYNHEQYIRQCLEGFVMQKTNFKFEAIVHDDASTDGTAAIILEYAERYPDIIKPIIETENQYSKHDGSLKRIMDAQMRGKYIAPCEGDDYWIDPLKLQKQVDFLEANSDYGLIFTNVNIYHESDRVLKKNFFNSSITEELNSISKYITNAPWVAPCSWLYKRLLLMDYLNFTKDISCIYGDMPLVFYFLVKSKIKFLNETTAVYRFLENSASHSSSLKKLYSNSTNVLNTRLRYAKKLNLSNQIIRQIYIKHYKAMYFCIWANGNKEEIDFMNDSLKNEGIKYKLLRFIPSNACTVAGYNMYDWILRLSKRLIKSILVYCVKFHFEKEATNSI